MQIQRSSTDLHVLMVEIGHEALAKPLARVDTSSKVRRVLVRIRLEKEKSDK